MSKEDFLNKLNRVSGALTEWSKRKFSKANRQIKSFKQELQAIINTTGFAYDRESTRDKTADEKTMATGKDVLRDEILG